MNLIRKIFFPNSRSWTKSTEEFRFRGKPMSLSWFGNWFKCRILRRYSPNCHCWAEFDISSKKESD